MRKSKEQHATGGGGDFIQHHPPSKMAHTQAADLNGRTHTMTEDGGRQGETQSGQGNARETDGWTVEDGATSGTDQRLEIGSRTTRYGREVRPPKRLNL